MQLFSFSSRAFCAAERGFLAGASVAAPAAESVGAAAGLAFALVLFALTLVCGAAACPSVVP